MRIESFLRHFTIVLVLTALVYPASAAPGGGKPVHLGKADNASIGQTPSCDEAERPPTDDGQKTEEDRGSPPPPQENDDKKTSRDKSRGKLSVREGALIDLSRQCRGRTRTRARNTARIASTRLLARSVLRRR